MKYRSQVDYDGDKMSLETGLAAGDEAGARQEFTRESDINVIVNRYGAFAGAALEFGEADFDMTLSDAYRATEAADEAFLRLPAPVQARYRSWSEIHHAISVGAFTSVEAAVEAAVEDSKGDPDA